MSSEILGGAENTLKGNLGGAWDIKHGYADAYTDLGVARRFGGAAAGYSLRDIGAMNGRVVKARRDVGETSDPEEDFSASQVQSGALEDWVNGKLESTLPADVDTAAAAYSLRKVRADYANDAVRIRRIDNTEVDVAFDLDDKVSTSSSITNVLSGDVDNTDETTLGNFLQGEANVRALFNSSAYFPTDSDYFSLGSGITLSGAFSISYDVVFTGSFGTNTSRIFQDDAGNDLLTFTASNVCKFRVATTVRTMPALSTNLQLGRKYSMIFARDASGVYTLTVDGAVLSTTSATDTDDFLIQRIGFRNRGSISNLNINSGQHIYAGNGAENSNWLDTGSSTTTNATKAGTPVAFTGQGMDSFVDIWYDQAGSNNAVQETAANQPKIAENGALLTDGLKFNGNSDNFTITNGVSGRSIFAVTNQNIDTTAGGSTGYGQDGISALLGTTATDSYVFVTNNNSAFNSYAISLDGAVSDSGQYASNGKTLSSAGGNLGTYGDIPSDTNSLLSIIYGSGDPANAWTRLGSGITGNIFMQGSMSEVILYSSDQSANRFKIESNINNYYGLYNDANDMAEAFRATAGTLTNESKDGFDLAVGTPTAYVGFEFNEKIANGDSVFISFNLDLTGGSGGDATPIMRLTKTTLDGTDSSNFINPSDLSQGFNSFELTSSDNDAKFFAISEGNDDVNISISDFKVSRIARDGFVETWYDQSGNGEDMTQGTAGNQPSIILNGGQVKDYKGNNSIDFVSGSTRVLDKSGTTTAKTCIVVLDEDSSGSASRAILGFSDSTSFMRLDAGTDLELKAGGSTANYRAVPTDVTSLYFWYTNGTDEDKLFANNVEEGDLTANTPPNLPFTRIGARNSDSDPYNSRITEVIAFAEDLSADRTVLQDDINNNYNIF